MSMSNSMSLNDFTNNDRISGHLFDSNSRHSLIGKRVPLILVLLNNSDLFNWSKYYGNSGN